jgi:hypothetical protein
MGYDYKDLLAPQRNQRLFLTAEDFLSACADYFNWVQDTPLLEEDLFNYKGTIVRADRKKARAMSKQGLAVYLGIPASRLTSYKDRGGDWAEATELVDQIIRNQKFELGAANLLNSSLISRDLGLADKQEHTGADGGPIQTEETTARDRITSRLAGLAARSAEDADTGQSD